MFKKIYVFTLIILIISNIAFIFENSVTVPEKSNNTSMAVSEKVQEIISNDKEIPITTINIVVRKSAHVIEFFTLGILLTLLKLSISKPQIFTVLFILLSVGVIDEFLQSFTNRTSLISDALIDFSGGIIGVLIVYFIYYIYKFIKKRLKTNE